MSNKPRSRSFKPAHTDSDESLHRRAQTLEAEAPEQFEPDQAEVLSRATAGGLRAALLGSADTGARTRISAQLQHSRGNAFVQRLVRQTGNSAVQRAPIQTEEPVLDLSGVGLKKQKLHGHGQTGGGSAPASAPAAVTPASAGAVTAAVNLTVNAPTIVRKTAREIASAHARPGSAGWTTPAYSISDPVVHGSSLVINVTLDFIIELDSARKDEALAVISDHEQGHVHIGQNKARQHLVSGFKAALEAMPRLSRSGYLTAQNTAITNFVTEEGSDSSSYDHVDYPRMMLANTGAKTPLSKLAKRFPDIAQISSALRAYNRKFVLSTHSFNYMIIDDAAIIERADAVIAATDALSGDSINLLQYNKPFKALVSHCRGLTNQYVTQKIYGTDMKNFMPSEENISAPVREKLQTLESSLGFFTWSAPV
jgi:hypothetical protein